MQVGLMLAVGGRETLWRSIDTPEFSIGRNPDCDLSVPDDAVEPLQCVLRRSGPLVVLIDESKNGTKLGGERVTGEARLADGDVIQLGPVTATVRYRGAAVGEGTRTLHAESRVTGGFVVKAGERMLEIGKRGVTIGSDPSNDVVLTDPYVSSFHARIAVDGGRCMVHDVGSRNGVFIGDLKVQAAEVMPPATVKIGRLPVEILPATSAATADAAPSAGGYVGSSELAKRVRTLAERMATNDAPVLLHGETGTGKEVVARLIASRGKRAGKPFVALNCGALSRTLVESELFGHEKGSFTGAVGRKAGAFEQAHGGTLFLDEIGELPLDLQPQLLRVLETGEVHRVGGNDDIKVDVRVVAATNRRLEEEVAANRFREDLFHRLHVLSLPLPPLRERAADIPELAQHFLTQLVPEGEKVRFDDAAMKALVNHRWPGNVRELRNVVQRAVLMRAGDVLTTADVVFPPSTSKAKTGMGDARTLAEIERSTIVNELVKHRGNKTDAAQALGISRSTIHRKIEEYSIDIEAEVAKADG